jgi:hypothetical protein
VRGDGAKHLFLQAISASRSAEEMEEVMRLELGFASQIRNGATPANSPRPLDRRRIEEVIHLELVFLPIQSEWSGSCSNPCLDRSRIEEVLIHGGTGFC